MRYSRSPTVHGKAREIDAGVDEGSVEERLEKGSVRIENTHVDFEDAMPNRLTFDVHRQTQMATCCGDGR